MWYGFRNCKSPFVNISCHLQWEKLLDFNAFPVNLHWLEDTKFAVCKARRASVCNWCVKIKHTKNVNNVIHFLCISVNEWFFQHVSKGPLVLIKVFWFHMVSSIPNYLPLRRKSLFRSTGSYQNRSTRLFSDKKCKNSVTNSRSIACKKLTSILLAKQRSTEDTPVLVNSAFKKKNKSAFKNSVS